MGLSQPVSGEQPLAHIRLARRLVRGQFVCANRTKIRTAVVGNVTNTLILWPFKLKHKQNTNGGDKYYKQTKGLQTMCLLLMFVNAVCVLKKMCWDLFSSSLLSWLFCSRRHSPEILHIVWTKFCKVWKNCSFLFDLSALPVLSGLGLTIGHPVVLPAQELKRAEGLSFALHFIN